jgi:hypothetical protein
VALCFLSAAQLAVPLEKTGAEKSECSMPFFLSHIKMSLSNFMPFTNKIQGDLTLKEVNQVLMRQPYELDRIFRCSILGTLSSSKQQDGEIRIMSIGSLDRSTPKVCTE